MPFRDVCVAADNVVLVGYPDDENDIEGCGAIVEKFRHDRFHS